MDLLGYSYIQERTFDVLDRVAENEGTGSTIMGTGMGLGMGINLGNTVGGAVEKWRSSPKHCILELHKVNPK